MRILLLGAAGFIGQRLLARLASGGLAGIGEIVATDARPPHPGHDLPPGLRFVPGDIGDAAFLASLFERPFDGIFHLAAALTLDAEADFDKGMRVNVHALMRLLELGRTQARAPRLVFAGSISSFGGPLPACVDDAVRQTPQTSYGTHKSLAELLINDYARRGFVDGRVLRLPVVLTHPGPATGSVSDRIAALVREPLAGQDTVCALRPDTPIAVASVDTVVRNLLALYRLPASVFGATRAMNHPALTVTPAQLVESVARLGPPGRVGAVRWVPDERLQQVVQGWPGRFVSELATRQGIVADESVDAIVRAHRDRAA